MSDPSRSATASAAAADRPEVVVLGAGITGIATAYYLNKLGLDVLVVERLPGPGLETSFANGGQVSVSHAEPWANPSAPLKVLKWLGRDDSPLLFRPRFDPQQWWWLASWMAECLPSRTRANTIRILELALHSRACIQQIRADEGLRYDAETRGILHFYRSQKDFDAAVPMAALMREYGCDREVVGPERILEIEPAFAGNLDKIVGATFTSTDESGDARAFTAALAEVCARNGVRFRWNTEVTAIHAEGGRLRDIEVKDLATARYERIATGSAVLALASWSPALVRDLGIRLNIYPAKGYSVTIPVNGSNLAPRTSLTDDEFKLVYSRLGDRLRVAGTAELSGYDRSLDPVRVRAILDNVRNLFPGAGDFDNAQAWTGLRPTTPSNVPYLGRSKVQGLYLNTGHGTLGWTMGPGTSARVAETVREDLGRAARPGREAGLPRAA